MPAGLTERKGERQPAAASWPACVFFTLIIDDLVLPDGTTAMGQLGGGGPQSAFGYQVASPTDAALALCAAIGPDAPAAALRWLVERRVSIDGLQRVPHATPRAWQVLEADGRRTQVWRTLHDEPEMRARLLRPAYASLGERVAAAPAFHIGVHPDTFELDLLRSLKAGRAGLERLCEPPSSAAWHPSAGGPPGCRPPGGALPWLSVETFTAAARQLAPDRLRALATCCDVVSPNLSEATSMVGRGTPEAIVERFMDAGAWICAVRMGAEGALLATRCESSAHRVHVPASPALVVDATGCGNAFCGALLAALQRGERLVDAASWGSAAAASMAEATGVPQQPLHALRPQVQERWQAVRSRCTVVHARAAPHRNAACRVFRCERRGLHARLVAQSLQTCQCSDGASN